MANLCIKTPSSASKVLIFQLLVLRPRPTVDINHLIVRNFNGDVGSPAVLVQSVTTFVFSFARIRVQASSSTLPQDVLSCSGKSPKNPMSHLD